MNDDVQGGVMRRLNLMKEVLMKHVLECNNCNSDITKPLNLGTDEYDYTVIADLDYDLEKLKRLEEHEARFVKVSYWTGLIWGDGDHVVENRYWFQIKEKTEDITSFSTNRGEQFQCDCGQVIGIHVGLWITHDDFWENQYLSIDPKVTSWIKYIDHGKKRKAAKKKRIKDRKKNDKK